MTAFGADFSHETGVGQEGESEGGGVAGRGLTRVTDQQELDEMLVSGGAVEIT